MSKKYLIALLSVLFVCGVIPVVSAQDNSEIVIAPQYDEISPINNELTRVRKNGMFGVIDAAGKMIAEPMFRTVYPLTDGLIGVETEDIQEGIIDQTGKLILEPVYAQFNKFDEGVSIVRKEDFGMGFIDQMGNFVVEPVYDAISNFHEGLAAVDMNGKWGFIDSMGNVVIDPVYAEVGDFHEGLAAFKKGGQRGRIGEAKYGFIDKTGAVVIEPAFDSVDYFSDGLAAFYKNGKYGYIDKTGTVTIDPFIESYSRFHDGLAAFKKDGMYGFIDKAGTVVIEPEYTYVRDLSNEFNGLILVGKERKEGLIDRSGKVIFEPVYNSIIPLGEGLAEVIQNGKKGAIDQTGKVVIEPVYDYFSSIIDGMIKVQKNGKYGFIDTTGKAITEPIYQLVYPFSDGLAAVQKDNFKWRFINKEGKEIITTDYDEVGHSSQYGGQIDVGVFRDGYALVSKRGKWSILDTTGRTVYNFQNQYASASFIGSNDRLIAIREVNKYGFIINPLHRLAESSTSKVKFNGREVGIEAYNIDGSNYFKLRDLAAILNKTEKNFEVGFDTTQNSILLTAKKAYTPIGGELTLSKSSASTEANLTNSKIYLDGTEIQLTAYNIDGNNFFKLRDIAQAFNFGVTWDGRVNTVVIDTKSVYIAEKQ